MKEVLYVTEYKCVGLCIFYFTLFSYAIRIFISSGIYISFTSA